MNTSARISAAQASYSKDLRAFVFMLFFAFGGITSLNDVIIPKLKALFTLSLRRGDAGAVRILRRLLPHLHSRRHAGASESATCVRPSSACSR